MLGAILMLGSCGEETAIYKKSQGLCGETWGDTFINYEPEEALAAATTVLDSLGISTETISIDSIDQGAVCVTCHDCPSGFYFVVEAKTEYESELLSLGFQL